METIDLVFSFDTTGSMYPCLTQVRRNVRDTVRRLFREISDLRVGIITHGDYCDGDKVITSLDLTADENDICKFIENAPSTNGGDSDECYELVLNHARSLHWTSGRNKAMVLIGDACPHAKGYHYLGKVNDLDWRNERDLLVEAGIHIYPVQALNRSGSNSFYEALNKNPEKAKLDLLQFADITDLVLALCFKRANKTKQLEEVLRKSSYNVKRVGDVLAGVKTKPRKDGIAEDKMFDGRFQVLSVDRNCSIKDFVEANGLRFKKGRGFYQFTKRETIQNYKEVVIQNKVTGAIHEKGHARRLARIPSVTSEVVPTSTGYDCFVQSTSSNRKLIAGTKFLYEIDDWS